MSPDSFPIRFSFNREIPAFHPQKLLLIFSGNIGKLIQIKQL